MPSPEASRDASSNVDGGGSSSSSSGPAPSAAAATSSSAAAAQPTPPPTRPIPFNFLIPTEAGATTTLTHAHAVPVSLLVPEPADTDLFVEVLGGALEARREQCRAAAPPACEVCYEAAQDVILTPVSFLHVNEEEEVDAVVGRQDEDDDKAAAVAGEGLVTAGPPSADGADGQSAAEGEMSRAKRAADGGGKKSKLGKRVDVLVTPVCAQPKCAALARRRVRSAMGGGGGGEDGPEDGEGEDDVTIAQGPEDPRCRTCGRTSGTRKCTGCGMVRYCGRDCQRADWKKGHKKMCQTFAALAEEARQVEEAQRE